VSATANVVIIAEIITKIGPSTHDERHQAALDRVPRSLVAAITFSMLIVGQASGNRTSLRVSPSASTLTLASRV
jgi:uncharacterized membrane protein YGL010W